MFRFFEFLAFSSTNRGKLNPESYSAEINTWNIYFWMLFWATGLGVEEFKNFSL